MWGEQFDILINLSFLFYLSASAYQSPPPLPSYCTLWNNVHLQHQKQHGPQILTFRRSHLLCQGRKTREVEKCCPGARMVLFQEQVFKVIGPAVPESGSRSLVTEGPVFSFIKAISGCLWHGWGGAPKHEAQGKSEEVSCPIVSLGFWAATQRSWEAANIRPSVVSQLFCRTACCLAAKILGLEAAGKNVQWGSEPAWRSQRNILLNCDPRRNPTLRSSFGRLHSVISGLPPIPRPLGAPLRSVSGTSAYCRSFPGQWDGGDPVTTQRNSQPDGECILSLRLVKLESKKK